MGQLSEQAKAYEEKDTVKGEISRIFKLVSLIEDKIFYETPMVETTKDSPTYSRIDSSLNDLISIGSKLSKINDSLDIL